MQNLKNLLITPLRVVPSKTKLFILLILAILGFADATYLSVKHFQGVIPPCGLTSGCDSVLTSIYSEIFGIPVALFGAIFYLVVAIGVLAYLEGKYEKILRYTLIITVFGLLAAIWFVSLQVFILQAYCLYCLVSASISTLIFLFSYQILSKKPAIFEKSSPRNL